MSFFKNLFGSSEPKKPPAPTVNDAIIKSKQALEMMDKKLLQLNHEYEQQKNNAKKLHQQTRQGKDNPRLKATLMKMKQIEGQITTLHAQRSNLDSQMSSLDAIAMNKVMVDAVRMANDASKQAMSGQL